jgi:hypothetical protein
LSWDEWEKTEEMKARGDHDRKRQHDVSLAKGRTSKGRVRAWTWYAYAVAEIVP